MENYKGMGIFVYCLAITAMTAVNFSQVQNFPKLATFNTIMMIISLITAVIAVTYWAMTSLNSYVFDPNNIIKEQTQTHIQNLFLFLLFSSICVLSILSAMSSDISNISSTARSLIYAEIGLSGFAIILLGISVI